MMPARRVGSVSHLPQVAFNAGGAITWWGMLGMMVVEGFTLVLVAAAYLYVWGNHLEWPPRRTPNPAIALPIVSLVVLLVSVAPAWLAERRARARDARGALRALVIQVTLCLVFLVIRYFEFRSLNVRWDTNAYGSVAWAVVVTHTLVALLDVLDTIGLALLFALAEPEAKHFVDTCENSAFWFFVVVAWLPMFVLVFLLPRWS
jgi:cytochrome c oxidase subunit III